MGAQKPFLSINHLEGHALTPRLVDDVPFPYLLLLVSGGHCQTLLVRGVGDYQRIGTTIDDAIGEAFDKTAKMMGLEMPGGPAVERLAARGDDRAVALPVPFKGRPGTDFSFSGLKTAVRRAVESDVSHRPEDVAASFQRVAFESLIDRTSRAVEAADAPLSALVVAGGVAANQVLSAKLQALGQERGLKVVVPPLSLCTDNGAMIAWAGAERLSARVSRRHWHAQLAAAPSARAGRWTLTRRSHPVRVQRRLNRCGCSEGLTVRVQRRLDPGFRNRCSGPWIASRQRWLAPVPSGPPSSGWRAAARPLNTSWTGRMSPRVALIGARTG